MCCPFCDCNTFLESYPPCNRSKTQSPPSVSSGCWSTILLDVRQLWLLLNCWSHFSSLVNANCVLTELECAQKFRFFLHSVTRGHLTSSWSTNDTDALWVQVVVSENLAFHITSQHLIFSSAYICHAAWANGESIFSLIKMAPNPRGV